MAGELLDLDPSHDESDTSDRVYSVAVAKVLSNIDQNNEGRVQISLPWLPGFEPWARVATLMGGMSRGTFFIPQVDDEVLVAFNQGDVREPYVIGSLWGTADRPPASQLTDPVNKRVIRTPLGHEIMFDDQQQEISITTNTKQTVTLGLNSVEIAAGRSSARSKITIDTQGNIAIEAKSSLKLSAPSISLSGKKVSIRGDASATIDGGADCTIKGGQVKIN